MKKFVTIVALTTIAGLTYVYAQVEAVKIGYTIRKQEEMKTLFLDRARALEYNISRMKAPSNLEKKLLAKKIQLESPKSWQTLVLPSGKRTNQPDVMRSILSHPPILARLFVGTAQAEARESSN